jgi:hypothetical protein
VVEEGFQNPVQDIWVEFAFHFDEIGLKDEWSTRQCVQNGTGREWPFSQQDLELQDTLRQQLRLLRFSASRGNRAGSSRLHEIGFPLPSRDPLN